MNSSLGNLESPKLIILPHDILPETRYVLFPRSLANLAFGRATAVEPHRTFSLTNGTWGEIEIQSSLFRNFGAPLS